ncbi:fibrous sheath-interacting protein 2 isoform X2 [Manis javanica]|uniref:fibrous sheath-interacting protein 2 isoform X2 n=1 Tax=Manis javanica TaxID=9974 RepID=UPI003C6D66F5
MERYLSACSNMASAANKMVASDLVADSRQCGHGADKTYFPGIGAAQLLDLPFGVKLPRIPGSDSLYSTTKLGEKLFQPSYGFNLTDPYCRILENQYNSLHDPHLRAYHQRKDILGRLKKGGYITNNNEVVCSLKEFNKYREYLRSLKLDFEKNCIKEQNQALPEKEMASHLPKIQENVFKRKEIKKNTFVYRGQDGTHSSRKKEKKTFDDVKVASAVGDQRANKGVNGPTSNAIHPSLSSSKNVVKTSVTSVVYQPDESNGTEQKKDGVITKNPSTFGNKGDGSSTFFSFLNPHNITQRIQCLTEKISTPVNRCLKWNQLASPTQSYKLTSLNSDQKNLVNTLAIDRRAMNRKKGFKGEETSMKKGNIQYPIVTTITGIMKNNVVNLLSESAAGVADKKEKENKMRISIRKYNENISKVTSTTSTKSKATKDPDLRLTHKNNDTEKESTSAPESEERQGNEAHTQFSAATNDIEHEKEIPGADFETDSEKINRVRENSLKKEDEPFHLSSLASKVRNTETITQKILKAATPKSNGMERQASPSQIAVNEEQYSDYDHVQNIIENTYDAVLEIYHSQGSTDDSHVQSPPSDRSLQVIQEVGKDTAQSVSTKDLSLSISKNLPAIEKEGEKEREKEKVKVKEIKIEPSKTDSHQYQPKHKAGIFPATFLEDIITEMINKLIFSSSPETQMCERCENVSEDENQTELYDTVMKLTDSLLKEFSDAQIKVFRRDPENQFLPPVENMSLSVPKVLSGHKESTAEKASSSIKKTVDEIPHMHKMTKNSSLNKIPFLNNIPAIDQTLVNKVVHSSVCNILKEYRSQDSICKSIKTNGETIARQLTSAVINEIFQQQLNFGFCDEIPASACLPLKSKDVVKKIQNVVKRASKEYQALSPYTVMLPHEFLENVISALLSKIFSSLSNTKAETPEGKRFTELDFLQMKLLSTVTTEISKYDMIIQYVDSLHPNDDEIIQLVVHSIYSDLLSQYGSREIIQNCVSSGCRILFKSIVGLILKEVSGNQLQNYFSGELTPYQCSEVNYIVENILKDVITTADAPQPQPRAHILPFDVIEETAVKFLSKLLSMFPTVDKERTKSGETEMQKMRKITSKILNSIQEFISKSNIKLVSPAKKLPTVPSADNETIEKIVNSVYTSVLKHSGSHISILKDLMGKSNALSNIIGFLMVQEISNSEFQPKFEEEVSNSELVLEAVKIMEKVVKTVDKFKSQEKSSSKKGPMLDTITLEEALALFLAKIVTLPSVSSKDAKNLSKPELNKIASQLTKSVAAEISKNNINLVSADPEEHFLNPESIEMISQVIDSIYSDILQQSGTHKDLYYNIKGTNRAFIKEVASLIINGVSNLQLDTVKLKNSSADLFGDQDINRIVEKAWKYADKMIPDLEKGESEQDSVEDEFPIKIVPHIRKKPVKIDPDIISEHLAVISVKTQSLEKLETDCLRKTGHNIEELRSAWRSISSSDTSNLGKIKKGRHASLTKTGQLDVRPLEKEGRNLTAERICYLTERIKSISSCKQEDLNSYASEIEDCTPDASAKIFEEIPKSSITKQGSKMLVKVSSALSNVSSPLSKVSSPLSKVCLRIKTRISKSSTPAGRLIAFNEEEEEGVNCKTRPKPGRFLGPSTSTQIKVKNSASVKVSPASPLQAWSRISVSPSPGGKAVQSSVQSEATTLGHTGVPGQSQASRGTNGAENGITHPPPTKILLSDKKAILPRVIELKRTPLRATGPSPPTCTAVRPGGSPRVTPRRPGRAG